MARPSKADTMLTTAKLKQIGAWASSGLTDADIAFNMGIAYSTFREWVKKYSKLSAVLKLNKDVADDNVERSLYQRAIGWDYVEEVRERVLENGEYKMVLTRETKKQVLPDTTAAIFWLKNRRPEAWREKQEIAIDSVQKEAVESLKELTTSLLTDTDATK